MRNRIINGAMMIDQRNAGASVSVSSTTYPLDRFPIICNAGSGHTAQQSSTAPAGFKNSLLVTIGTGASPSAGNVCQIYQAIEGLNVPDLAWGTANAQPVTVSFWIRSSVTGTFSGSVINSALNRSYAFTYAISSANTFEYKTVTIPGDQSGTWLTTNGVGIYLVIDLGSGSTYQGSAGAWSAGDYRAATGSTKLVATSGATLYLTGVQLEEGTAATAFEQRLYGTELALCQRYCYVISQANNSPYDGYTVIGLGYAATTSNAYAFITVPVSMRAPPTVSRMGSSSTPLLWSNNTGSVSGLAINELYGWNTDRGRLRFDKTTSFTAGAAGNAWFDGALSPLDNKYIWSAEL
jgi:hypothetical protein